MQPLKYTQLHPGTVKKVRIGYIFYAIEGCLVKTIVILDLFVCVTNIKVKFPPYILLHTDVSSSWLGAVIVQLSSYWDLIIVPTTLKQSVKL